MTVAWLRANASYQGDDCLIWPFSIVGRGYGHFAVNGVHHYAHRFMCELVNGAPPSPKHQAAHSCGNGHKACVNPRHLSWATNSQNQLDRRKHGTNARGGTGWVGKVTDQQIAIMRDLRGKKSQVEIAAMLGVSPGCVEYWQHERQRRGTRDWSGSKVYRRRNP